MTQVYRFLFIFLDAYFFDQVKVAKDVVVSDGGRAGGKPEPETEGEQEQEFHRLYIFVASIWQWILILTFSIFLLSALAFSIK